MSKYKEYGKWFAIAVSGAGFLLLVILVLLGVPFWLALFLAVIGSIPVTIGLGMFGLFAWLDMAPTDREIERAEREEQARHGQQFLERSKRGRPRRTSWSSDWLNTDSRKADDETNAGCDTVCPTTSRSAVQPPFRSVPEPHRSRPMLASIRTSLTALLCAVAVFATACGGGSSDAGTVASGADSTASSTESADAASSASTESPLADLIGIPFGDDEATDQYFADLSRQAEVKIAECMLSQGFEYQVVDYSQLGGLATAVDFDTREFAEQYGFGIASNPFEESFEAFESFQDPNQEYLESLTEGERDAYQLALSGELPDFSSTDVESFEPTGCQGDAFNELFAFGRVFEEFGGQFDEIEQAYYADPRIVDASAGWGACMTEAGYRYSDQDGAESDVQRRYDAIIADPGAFVSIEEQLEEAGSDPEDGSSFTFGPQTLRPAFQAEVDELAVEERAIALASWDCNGPLREIEDEVRVEYEQRFVDENGAAIREALGN